MGESFILRQPPLYKMHCFDHELTFKTMAYGDQKKKKKRLRVTPE